MFFKNKLKNYAKGSDERTVEIVGRSASLTLIIGLVIFLVEMFVKFEITKNLRSIIWEASLLLLMIVLFIIIHLLNKIPINNNQKPY